PVGSYATWVTPADITYGTPLSAAQLDATANVPGTFVYTAAAGTVLGAGTRTLSVTFTPDDTTDYTGASATVTLVVDRATLTVTAGGATRTYGAADPAFTDTVSGFVNGDAAGVVSGSPTLTTAATVGTAPGAYAITADPGTLSAANYTFLPVRGTLTVTPAPLSAAAGNVSASAGVPFSRPVATFSSADPY